MSSKITIDELEKYLWGSAVLLRTHVDAGAYKQYIFPLLFFKRLSDVYDEECEKVRASLVKRHLIGKKTISSRFRMEHIGMM